MSDHHIWQRDDLFRSLARVKGVYGRDWDRCTRSSGRQRRAELESLIERRAYRLQWWDGSKRISDRNRLDTGLGNAPDGFHNGIEIAIPKSSGAIYRH